MRFLRWRAIPVWSGFAAAAVLGGCAVCAAGGGRLFGLATSASIALLVCASAVVAILAWRRHASGAGTGNTLKELAELLDNAPVLVWRTDAAGRRTFVNTGWLRFTGRGLSDESTRSNGIGLRNTVERLTQTFGAKASLTVHPARTGGTIVDVHIPLPGLKEQFV